MKDIFIADAHLKNPSDENYIQLLKFLTQNRGKIRTLILLGDIFEFWLGYRHCVYSAYLPLLHELHALKQNGTKIVMVEGNHDFNVGPFFSATLGARIIPDGGCITLDGTHIWVEHGDLIKPSRTYLWLRKFFRSQGAKMLARIIHPDLLWDIAALLGNWSKKQRLRRQINKNNSPAATCPKRSAASHIPQKEIIAAMQQRAEMGCAALVCGHFHHSWHHQCAQGDILVVGDWGNFGTYAEYSAGIFTIRQFTPSLTADPAD